MKYATLSLLLAASASHAAIVQYTDRASFLAALPGGYLSTDFSNLSPGDQGTSSLLLFNSVPGASLWVDTRDAANNFEGNPFWVSDTGNLSHALGASTTYSDQIRISNPGGFHAIGGDWFLGDIDDNYLAGTVTLTFSDGSIYNITSTSQSGSFGGFISDIPLTSVFVTPQDPINTAGWATVDNLVIPEPSTTLAGGVGILLLSSRRARRS